ncbi:MAG: hypothetical protein K2M19_01665 [Muribaculaceae bacterium]|nr:hypothetical protein [Muribaculaceae bacterium]
MTDDQLRQIILDAYDARPETKEYFEFFLNPDVDRLLSRLEARLQKEYQRTKWGRSKVRTTVIKRCLNDVITLNPGPAVVIDALMLALSGLALTDKFVELNEAQKKLGVWILKKVVDCADSAMIFSEIAPKIEEFMHNPAHRNSFMRYLADNLELPFRH